jgi:hypothetical protein
MFLIWNIMSSLRFYLHSLFYFNEFVGGVKNGHRYLLGSCIDWGQDEYELRDWFRKCPKTKPLYLLFAVNSARKTGDSKIGVVSGIAGKWVWIIFGVDKLYDPKGKYNEYRKMRPVERIGKSVYVFYIEK